MLRRILLSAAILILALPAVPVTAQASGPVYIVQPGDTLSAIAARFNIDTVELMSANNLSNPDQLAAGQQLVIPGLEGVNGTLITEVVPYGDSFRSLSRRSQTPLTTLRKLNRLVSPTELYAGISLVIPQADATKSLSARMGLAPGETLLEASVRQDTNPWTLASVNNLAGTWAGLPGDVLYTPSSSSDQNATGLPAIFTSARISSLPLKQGGTAEIHVQTSQPATLAGVLVDKQLRFFPDGQGGYVALQGVHAKLEPGVYPLRLEATLADGSLQSFEQMVLVTTGNYAEDPLLYVDPATIDPQVTQPELDMLVSLVANATTEKFWGATFTSPASQYAESSYFTSKFGNRRTYVGQGTDVKVDSFHTGLDFGGGTGLPITAPAPGKIIFAGPLSVRGNATVIDHGWGVYSGFWHQSEIKVQVGQSVVQDEVIGLVGGTGRVTGAHLHWELWVNGVQVDPLDWLGQVYPRE